MLCARSGFAKAWFLNGFYLLFVAIGAWFQQSPALLKNLKPAIQLIGAYS